MIIALSQLSQPNPAQLFLPNLVAPNIANIMQKHGLDSFNGHFTHRANPQEPITISKLFLQQDTQPETINDAAYYTPDTMNYMYTSLTPYIFNPTALLILPTDRAANAPLIENSFPKSELLFPSISLQQTAHHKIDLKTNLVTYEPLHCVLDAVSSSYYTFNSEVIRKNTLIIRTTTTTSEHDSLRSLQPEQVGFANAHITGRPDNQKLSLQMQPIELGAIYVTMDLSIQHPPELSLTALDNATFKLMRDDLASSSVVVVAEAFQPTTDQTVNSFKASNVTVDNPKDKAAADGIYDKDRPHDLYHNAENAPGADTDFGSSNFRRPRNGPLTPFVFPLRSHNTNNFCSDAHVEPHNYHPYTLRITA